jgi:hypothetical protein
VLLVHAPHLALTVAVCLHRTRELRVAAIVCGASCARTSRGRAVSISVHTAYSLDLSVVMCTVSFQLRLSCVLHFLALIVISGQLWNFRLIAWCSDFMHQK